MTLASTAVAALYIDPRGPYPKLLGPEMCWDEQRDARTYAGPWPVVAHPPCACWSSLRHLTKRWEDGTADAAAKAVRSFGGVLEQPAGSKMWDVFGFPKPGDPYVDPWGGCSWAIDQCRFGHPARKMTWLYCVRTKRPSVYPPDREPTHWCSGGRTKRPGMGATVPPGIKVCSAQQRRRTPLAFAEWLISLASTAQRTPAPVALECPHPPAKQYRDEDGEWHCEACESPAPVALGRADGRQT